MEGDLAPLVDGIVPGHEGVGSIVALGGAVRGFSVGDRVGLPWLRSTCGTCEFCRTGRENLCAQKRFTGYSDPGAYAELALGEAAYVLPLPAGNPDRLAPLLCAGLIGYPAFRLAATPPGGRLGFFGFGGSAHLTLPLATRLGFETVGISRNARHVELARRLGASEAHLASGPEPPAGVRPLDSALVFAPSGEVVLSALRLLKKGGRVVIAAIHLSPIPSIDYDRWLSGERSIHSVEANTRADAAEYLRLALRLGITASTRTVPLREANEALIDLKEDRVAGTVVLDCRAP